MTEKLSEPAAPSPERGDAELVVYYDGACPRCRRDRRRYEALAGDDAGQVAWFDITGRESRLRALGIDPDRALTELHVSDREGRIYRELDAYRVLMKRIGLLRPVAWFIGLPVIRPGLSGLYRRWVRRRLTRQGRLP